MPGKQSKLVWNDIAPGDQFVQFYETDDVLINTVNGFIGAGLQAGDGGVVLATHEHLARIEDRLHMRGINVVHAKWDDQYIAMDAVDLLGTVMDSKGFPDRVKFKTIVGDILHRAGHGDRRVRVFAEKAAVLHSRGNEAGAIQVAALWNELARSEQFTLFSAYPLEGLKKRGGERFRAEISSKFSQVIDASGKTVRANK